MADINDAVLYAFASSYSGSGDWLNEGTGLGGADGTITGATYRSWNATDGNYWRSNGLATTYVSTPDATAWDIVDDGDIDIRVRVALDDWTPTARQRLIAKLKSDATAGWALAIGQTSDTTPGEMRWNIGNGASRVVVSTAAPGFTDGTKQIVRLVYDSSTGLANFYTADDPDMADIGSASGWSLLGTGDQAMSGGATTASNDTAKVVLTNSAEGAGVMNGNIYEVWVKDTTAAVVVGHFKASGWTDLTTTYTDGADTPKVWTATHGSAAEIARIVDRSHFWFDGVNDRIIWSDHADLDFGASDDFTVGAGLRGYDFDLGSPLSILNKRNAAGGFSAGWGLVAENGANAGSFIFGDGTGGANDRFASPGNGEAVTWIGVRNVGDDDAELFEHGVGSGSPATDTSTGSLANAIDLGVGSHGNGSASYFKGEIWAISVNAAAFTDGEVGTGTGTLHDSLLNQTAAVDDSTSPATIVTTTAMPAVGVATGPDTPATIVTTTLLPAPTVTYGWTVTPATIVTTTAMPAPTVLSTNTVTPATIITVTAFPALVHVGLPLPTATFKLLANQRGRFYLAANLTGSLNLLANERGRFPLASE